MIRRGPTSWCGVGRWDVATGRYEHGAWLRGRIYPQRCDLSPGGKWLCYFALQPSAKWELGWTYVAVSRLPWLYALAAWRTDGTWTRGAHFADDPAVREIAPPDNGSLPYDLLSAGMAVTRAATYEVKRRRGWVEAEGSPPRAPTDAWDERRAESLRMVKPRPASGGAVRLEVSGGYAAFRSGGFSTNVSYRVVDAGQAVALPGVQWADWARDGRLLVATAAGQLETRGAGSWLTADLIVADLAHDEPTLTAAPPEAHRWEP